MTSGSAGANGPIGDLPRAAFADPSGRNRAEIEALMRRALDMVIDRAATAASRSPLPDAPLPEGWDRIPDAPLAEEEILERLLAAMDGSMNAAHPGYIGHMDSIPATFSILGDLAAGALNNNMLSMDMSALLSRLEPALVRTFAREFFGLGEASGGLLISGGSLANLEALAVARNSAFGSRESGIACLGRRPVLFASELCHSSIHKAAMVLGLGTRAVISIPADARGKMDVARLRAEIAAARSRGDAPFCAVATAGTTVTGNIDPIDEIADVARAENLWFHVDAVFGGALRFSRSRARMLNGIERADSVSFNPQKWLYVTKTCGMVLFRDFARLEDLFRVEANYMRARADFSNLGEFGLQGTRHVDVLKLWLTLLHFGRSGWERLIEHGFALAEFFTAQIRRRPYLKLATPPEMNVICFRGEPDWIAPARRDAWNAELQANLLKEGDIFLSLPLLRGERWLKAVLLNPFTDPEHLGRMFARIDDFARLSRSEADKPHRHPPNR